MAQLRAVFGWQAVDVAAAGAYTEHTDLVETARQLDMRHLEPSETSARGITDPFWYYVHIVMLRTLLARVNGNDKLTIRDCALLGALLRGRVPRWGNLFCQHLKLIRPRGPLCIGGMVTYLLRQLHPKFGDLPGQQVRHCSYADRARLRSGQNIRVTSGDVIQWIYFRDPNRMPDISPPCARRRPAGDGSGRRHERDEFVPLDVIPPEQEQQSPDERAHIDYIFHMTRTLGFDFARGLHPVPAPPGWRPGDAILPEYRPLQH